MPTEMTFQNVCSSLPTKKCKVSIPSKRDKQTEEMIEVEKNLQIAVSEIRNELKHANFILAEAVAEIKKNNENQQQFNEIVATYIRRQQNEDTQPNLRFFKFN